MSATAPAAASASPAPAAPVAPVAPFALFEDNLGAPHSALLLHGHVATLDCARAEQAERFFHDVDEQTRQGRWVALIAHYEFGAAFEPRALTPPAGRLARALVFESGAHLDAAQLDAWWQAQLAALTPQARDAGVLHLTPSVDRTAFASMAQAVLDYIAQGDCYQVNLTFPMQGEYFGSPLALYARLREQQPVRHGALLFDAEEWLLSRSPELFFERRGQCITCRPMKGTAARGNSEEEDARAAQALVTSEKNRAENLMIVDLIRNDLGRIAQAGDVSVPALFELETYATVFQLTSTVQARGVSAPLSEVFRAVFPCGSITGAPKVRAMQLIDSLETATRGPYCGALGWLSPGSADTALDDCYFNVPIRTLRLMPDGRCRLDVGSGIVADSEPGSEYDECLLKARFVTEDGLQLIETLRCEIYGSNRDEAYPLLAWHLQRLSGSARTLHFGYDELRVRQALLDVAAALSPGLHRVRLVLARSGEVCVAHAPLDELPPRPSIAIASERLRSNDARLRHKTTARRFYDDALREAMAAGHFDVVYLNERGEVCEGARSNVFIERADRLLTPPVSSGLLPGVMRAQLVAAGAAEECVLSMEDLQHADRIYMGNALRGLVEVRLHTP